jgi:succinate dehydrogenase / fumarate reductase iron-sulfur subunit
MRSFTVIKDLVTDVSFNLEMAKKIPPLKPRPRDADGTWRMQQKDIDRIQEFRKCIECFLCQDVCHVIRDHQKTNFAGPRFLIHLAGLDMHPLDTLDRRELVKDEFKIGLCNITKCCSEVCPEHIHITDNGIIPLKERVADDYFDPVRWALDKVAGGEKKERARLPMVKEDLHQTKRATPDSKRGQ